MTIPKELTTVLSTFNNGMIWVYIGLFLICMYLLISLLTWSFIKPLKYLGIPTCFVGVFFLIIRLSSSLVLNIFEEKANIIKILLPSMLKPILFNGIIALLIGVLMIILYVVVNNNRKKDIQIMDEKVMN